MAASREEDLRYEGWRVAAVSGASLFFVSFVIYTFPIFFKPLALEFSWSREAVSSAFGLMTLTAAVTAPLVGYVADRSHVRYIVAPCMVVMGCAFASLGLLASRPWQFYGTFVLLGAVAAGVSPVGYSRAVSTWFQQRRGLALGVVIAGGAVAGVVQPPATQALLDLAGWRTAYLVIGLSMVIIGFPLAMFIRERPSEEPATTVTGAGVTFGEGLRSRRFWTLIVVFFAAAVAMNGAVVHLSALLTDHGVSPPSAALAVSTMGASSLAGRLATGWSLDRFFGGSVSFVLLSIAALGTYLLASADSFTSGAIAAALIGFGMGGELDVTPYLLSRYFGLGAFSRLYSLAFGSSAVAGAVGPILLGRTFDATGSYDTLLPKIALFMTAIATLMLTLPRYDLRSDAQGARDTPPRPCSRTTRQVE